MRIAWLIQGINHNLDTCLRALARLDHELLVIHQASMLDTAFDASSYCDYAQTLVWEQPPENRRLLPLVQGFSPDAVVMAGWSWPPSYRACMKSLGPAVLRILAMDNTWHGTRRQWLGRLAHPVYISPLFDCVAVPSDRTEWLARRLGFGTGDIIRGTYTADTALFDRGPRTGEELARHQSFLFVGRLVREKSIDVLASAYRSYREQTDAPWELHLVGRGELDRLLEGIPGVVRHGFRQPPELAQLMQRASCFLLPSRFEPYGVVVHEAGIAGLPLLVSDCVGAGPGLVQDGVNGWVLPCEDIAAWATALERVARLGIERLEHMSTVSRQLASRLTVDGWARNLEEQLEQRVPVPAERRARVRNRPRGW